MLVELTQPHKLEAAKKTESRPYYQKEDGGSTREERTAQAIAKLADEAKMVARKKMLQDRVHKEAVAGLSVKIHAYSDDDDDDDDDDGPAEASGRPRTATI